MSTVTTLLLRIATVPLFLIFVGTVRYGYWLLVTAIPSYLMLSDVGFASACATAATQALAAGHPRRARRYIVSGWLSVTIITGFALILIGLLTSTMIPASRFGPLRHEAHAIIWVELLWVACWLQIGFCEAAMRAAGEFARGLNYFSLLRIAEAMALAAVIATTGNLLLVAVAQLLVCMAGGLLIYRQTRHRLGWFAFRVRSASWRVVKALAGPSVSYGGFSLGTSALAQGLILLVGRDLGASALVLYSVVKMATNSIFSATGIATTGALPELTIAYARHDIARAQRIRQVSLFGAIGIAVVGAAALIAFGPFIIGYWSAGRVVAPRSFIVLMALTTVADVPWQVYVSYLRARNEHQATSLVYLLCCALAFVITLALLPYGGLRIVPLALFVLDFGMTPMVLSTAKRRLPSVRTSV